MSIDLSVREKTILRYIIENFIRSANPVGSKFISSTTDINLSSASIRNVMSDLEEKDFLTHNHTSGGRLPTDKGYRFFVNELMEVEPLAQNDKSKIKKHIEEFDLSTDEIYKEVSKILGRLTNEISIVSQPYFSDGILEKIELISLSSTKILIVVSIKSGLVRTLIFDIETSLSKERLESIARILNEKLCGLTLREIRNTFQERITSLTEDSEIIKVFVGSIDKIFQDEKEGLTLYMGGTVEILSQPEFEDTSNYKNIIEFTENKHIVYHVLNQLPEDEDNISISIGGENTKILLEDKLKNYSIVSTSYDKDGLKGKIALIGPKRMNYSKMVSMLNFTSKLISEKI